MATTGFALVALAIVGFALISGRIHDSPITPPIRGARKGAAGSSTGVQTW